MNYTIDRVDVVRYPVVRVTFDDGFAGEYDFTDMIATGPALAALRDPAVFGTVSIGERGHSFGWFLDRCGCEIDFCPDATRIKLETQAVEQLAASYRARRPAAE